MTWNVEPMTYGSDNFPEDLVIDIQSIERNKSLLNSGELVLFWPYENRVLEGLYKVEESGYSLFCDEGTFEGLFLPNSSPNGTGLVLWKNARVFYESNFIDYTTINGVAAEEYNEFPFAEGRRFASFPANKTFTIGMIEGTTLVEKEYTTDYKYFLQADTRSSYTLTPTFDGYAIFDFSETDPGEYIYTVSYWSSGSRKRIAHSTYIVIE